MNILEATFKRLNLPVIDGQDASEDVKTVVDDTVDLNNIEADVVQHINMLKTEIG